MSWFNFNKVRVYHNRNYERISAEDVKKMTPEDREKLVISYETDYDKITEGKNFLVENERNKGKNVIVFDDNLFRELTDKEVQELESVLQHGDKSVIIPISKNGSSVDITPKIVREKKTRKSIGSILREAVLDKFGHRCLECGT
ncbi:MAG: hypothetical protein ACM31H_00420 [Nitrososphaerales archaeon]